QQPAVQQPAVQQPAVQQPAVQQPIAQRITPRPYLPSDQIAQVFERLALDSESTSVLTPPVNADDDMSVDEGVPRSDGSSKSPASAKEIRQQRIDQLIIQLGEPTFAARERAAAELHAIGNDAIVKLRAVAEDESRDVEVRMRADDVVRGVVGSQRAGRIDEFLRGGPGDFDGWPVIQDILGDSIRVREMFVELHMRHRPMLTSLSGTPNDRRQAWLGVVARIQRGLFVERRPPTSTDALALLLLANDPRNPLNTTDDEILLSVLRKEAATNLRRDPQLKGPVNALVGGWIRRSGYASRDNVLWFGLSWELADTLTIAIDTLQRDALPAELVGICLRVVARFGDRSHVPIVADYLDDHRAASEMQIDLGVPSQAQLADCAAATIALIRGESLDKYGMNKNAYHAQYGFVPAELRQPLNDPKPRQVILDSIGKVLP
ncbi:MAG: hypothetical protein AAF745_06250, partial [Planctomycetota bacterium]